MQSWKNVSVSLKDNILTVLDTIDKAAIGAALVLDESQHLLGIVTDGDIRRGLLKGITVDMPISHVMNSTPRTARLGESKDSILKILTTHALQQIPLVDDENRLVGLETLSHLNKPSVSDNWVVLMAGGLGTRLRPLTEDCPKPLLKIDSKPVLQIILENFMAHGFYRFIFSLNYRGDMIEDYFGTGEKWGAEIKYVTEDKPLGTAGALSLLEEMPDQPFFVMNGDIMTRVNMSHLLAFHKSQGKQATVCVREHQQTVPYGVVHINENTLLALEEKPVQRFFVNAGIYVLEPSVIAAIPKNEYCDMPNLLTDLIRSRANKSTRSV